MKLFFKTTFQIDLDVKFWHPCWIRTVNVATRKFGVAAVKIRTNLIYCLELH